MLFLYNWRMKENKRELAWVVSEYGTHQKSNDWHWTIATVAIAAAVISGFFGNFLFAVLAIIAGMTLVFHGKRGKHELRIAVTLRGVRVNNELYPYDHMHSFWLDDEHNPPTLYIKLNRMFFPVIDIPIGEMSENLLRGFLLQYANEEEYKPTFAHNITEALGL